LPNQLKKNKNKNIYKVLTKSLCGFLSFYLLKVMGVACALPLLQKMEVKKQTEQ
jgi:hypothetical protein